MNANRSVPALSHFAGVMALLAVTSGCTSAQGDSTPAAPTERLQVVLDFSPTLSDAGALLYLASNPAVELLAVTLPGTGEADCEPGTRTTRSLLVIAGQPEVPVGCGRDEPLAGDRDWPEEWRTEVNRWGGDFLPSVPEQAVGDAEQLLIDTLSGASNPVTMVAVGPLTNLGAVLASQPALADRIARIVIMGGAVTVPGNVEASPDAEWNIYIDPEAARRVIAAGTAVTFVPLDATNHVPWTERLLSRLGGLDAPAADAVHQMAASRQSLAGFYLWDELAAMAAVTPELVTVERMTIRVDDDGATVQDPAGVAVDVAVDAESTLATDEFMRVLNGGSLPDVVPLTAGEREYMMAMNAADGRATVGFSSVFDQFGAAAPDPRRAAATFIEEYLAVAESLADELRAMTPPASLRTLHDRYVDSLDRLVSSKEQLLAAIASSEGGNVDEVMNDAMRAAGGESTYADFRSACHALEDFSFTHGGPRPCSAAVDG